MKGYSGYFTFLQLKSRGWNQGLIDRFLVEHDALRNPSKQSLEILPVKLYSRQRTLEAEGKSEFPPIKSRKKKRTDYVAIRKYTDKHFRQYIDAYYKRKSDALHQNPKKTD